MLSLVDMIGFLMVRQRKFVIALRAFCHCTLHRRWAAGTGKCSTVGYVEREATFWAMYHMFRLRTHPKSSYLGQPLSQDLKTFLETLKGNDAQTLTLKVNK
jgi:hypothetical protein